MLPTIALTSAYAITNGHEERQAPTRFKSIITWEGPNKKVSRGVIANTQYKRGVRFDPTQTNIGYKNQKLWKQANYWYLKSAENGNAKAQCRLARDYAKGLGFQANAAKAIYWYRRSADQGNPIAEVNMAIAYANGIDVHSDTSRVIYWFRKSALQGNSMAENNLGIAYEVGRGAHKNYRKAIHWFSLAASKNNARAQYNLGSIYFRGLGVPKNMPRAIYWLQESAEQGDYAAKTILNYAKGVMKDKSSSVYHNKQ
ncbi:tetratricopeptide repeat protein [Acidihalobacter yilgarnensis]|uniref:tetratricopeptide repeat protein n=1 Tax=Acidihalobacter yilgarnensis TaxID=2819280 RepID=UPI0009F36173|nr:tetratricopeptide repeat protein [Acidihalobacter yilgarnensis]